MKKKAPSNYVRVKATELEFLKYFYQAADFGPADQDVRNIIKEAFMEDSGDNLPEGYELE